MTPRDEARQNAVRELLDAGKVQTAEDFRYASLIQLSNKQGDLMQALIKWLMAATMDRYLHSIQKPQIFGTQFYSMDGKPGLWSRTTAPPSPMPRVRSGA